MKLKECVAGYVEYRRSLGAKFVAGEAVLMTFARILGLESDVGGIGLSGIERFLFGSRGVTATSRTRRGILQGFFRWLVIRGHAEGLPKIPDVSGDVQSLRPYIYTQDEVRALLAASRTYQRRRDLCLAYPECVRMIVFLTYALGLRIRETLSLTLSDVHSGEMALLVRETKFFKTRVVPYNACVARELGVFLEWRRKARLPRDPESLLFVDRRRAPMLYRNVLTIFHRLCEVAGIRRDDQTRYGPRIHDLRHTFAVQRLTCWYREGRDVQALLPVLSTYLGHASIGGTSVYLTMTPALLEAAGARFEGYAAGKGDDR